SIGNSTLELSTRCVRIEWGKSGSCRSSEGPRCLLPGKVESDGRERSRIEGAVAAGRVEGQDATPESVSAEEDFAGEEPEPSTGDSQDGLAEDT
ncbi:unnamed protein product, partial [Ascophyllum nodosum]